MNFLLLAGLEAAAGLALNCVHQEYPNKVSHVLNADADAQTPRNLYPAFYGCFDWHSAVHGHWLLARLARLAPQSPLAAKARAALAQSITVKNIEGEAAYMAAENRKSFERPYGLAWLLQLASELREWDDDEARRWALSLELVERAAVSRLSEWIPKLTKPIRSGTHAQTAFAFGLILDYARGVKNAELAALLETRTRELYGADKACPLSYEPSGHDFLSPCFAEADLLRRVMGKEEFGSWLREFLPAIPEDGGSAWLPLGVVTDKSDGHLAHLDGLNLSRAWMLEGIASGLPAGDKRLEAITAAAAAHRRVGLASLEDTHYMGGHWLGSFAAYLVTGRGL